MQLYRSSEVVCKHVTCGCGGSIIAKPKSKDSIEKAAAQAESLVPQPGYSRILDLPNYA